LRCRFPHGDADVRLTHELLSSELGPRLALGTTEQGNWVMNFFLTLWLVRLHIGTQEQESLFEALVGRNHQRRYRMPALMNDCTN